MNFTLLRYLESIEFQNFTILHTQEKKIEIKNFISKKVKLPIENLQSKHGIKIEGITFDVKCPDCDFKIGRGEINNLGILTIQFVFKITPENVVEKEYKVGLHSACCNLHDYFDYLR